MSKRILAIDVLRGIILLGVVIVNGVTINGPFYLDTIDFAYDHHWLDQYTDDILYLIFLEKFYPIFVFLFGLSNQLFLTSLYNKYQQIYTNKKILQNKIFKIFTHRMLVLGLIGLIHLSLFYWGDVLFVYAVLGFNLGFLLNYVFKKNYKNLYILNLLLTIFSITINFTITQQLTYDIKHDSFDEHYIHVTSNHSLHTIESIYQETSLLNIVKHNMDSYYRLFAYGIFDDIDCLILLDNINYFIELFILMVFGAILALTPNWYNKLFNLSNKNIISIICGSLSIAILAELELSSLNLENFNIILVLNNILLYLSIFLLFFKNFSHSKKLDSYIEKTAAIGRMTLTWYLLHSCSMSFILYNYGFSLYGKITITTCVLIAIIYYYFCYKVSSLYLARYKQGPIEKLWRDLTVPKLKLIKQN